MIVVAGLIPAIDVIKEVVVVTRPPAACLIGWPAAHSRSPLIHHYWLRTLGIEGGYVIEAVPPDEFKDFVFRLSLRGFVGANVTIPHKERALALSKPDERARAVGAANTLWYRGRRTVLDQHRRRGFHQQSRCLRARMGQRRGRAGAGRRRLVARGGVRIARARHQARASGQPHPRARPRAGRSIRRARSARGVGCDR